MDLNSRLRDQPDKRCKYNYYERVTLTMHQASFCIFEHLISKNPRVFRANIFMGLMCVNNSDIFFLSVASIRLVVDEDDNGKFRLDRIKATQSG